MGGKERQLQEPVWPPRPVWEQGQSFPEQMLFWRAVLNKLNSFHPSPESARRSSELAMGTGPDCAVTKENFSFKSSLLRTGDFLRLETRGRPLLPRGRGRRHRRQMAGMDGCTPGLPPLPCASRWASAGGLPGIPANRAFCTTAGAGLASSCCHPREQY